MTPERWAQIRQTFEGALERPQKDRAAYLRVVCARDDEMRREVEALLRSHDESTNFLNQPAVDLNRVISSLGGVTNLGTSGAFAAAGESSEYSSGMRVGPYQLQTCIGKGGMGSVWLANRFDQDFRRNVAVKLVKRGMDSQEILRRFRLERQVLAGLEHTNIARLIDGGSTQEGLPYLVMEYVEGTPIDRYCESRNLSISDRLKLFRDVCSAVQYAHQNLVVHRDIKAGNILVTSDGTPKLLDFGIAKLMRTEFSTLLAAETRPELRPMTLDYASPEQVRGEAITTSTDVYSLGVLLYKLLTGKFPYGLEQHSHAGMQKAICETEAIKPSSVILTDEKTLIPQATQKIEVGEETRAKARKRLRKKLGGDLDMIILKALRKEPPRRYISVEQFSEDLRRYLEGRPVIARSDTFGYRTGKFLRRNLAPVVAASLVGLALLAGTAVSVRYARQAEQARTLAEQQVREAQTNDLRAQSDLLGAQVELGGLKASAGDAEGALRAYRIALEAARRLSRSHPEQSALRRTLAETAVHIAQLAPEEAPARLTEAASQFESIGAQSDLAESLRALGAAQLRSNGRLAALATFSRALQAAETQTARTPNDRRAKLDLAAANFAVGATLARNGEPGAASAKLRKAFDLYQDLTGAKTAAENTPAALEQAIERLATSAPSDVRTDFEKIASAFR